MNTPPAAHAIGCVSGFILLSSFASGVYQGLTQSKPNLDSGFVTFIRYAPIAANTLFGFASAHVIVNDRTSLESMVDDMTNASPFPSHRDHAQGCFKGCAPILYPLTGAALTAGVQYLGYVMGRSMSNSV